MTEGSAEGSSWAHGGSGGPGRSPRAGRLFSEAYRGTEGVKAVAWGLAVRALPHQGGCAFPDADCSCGAAESRQRLAAELIESVLPQVRAVDTVGEVERYGALVIETRGPWADSERPALAEVRAVTDWGPWAQHNFPCPVCKERGARVDLAGWVFSPCDHCTVAGWELRIRHKRWWERLTRRR